MKKFEIIKDYY